MTTQLIGGKFREVDANGAPLAGGLLYSYAAGTLTPLATYTDYGGLSANTNPVVLDASGRADIWLGVASYRLILKSSVGVTIWDEDNVTNSGPADRLRTQLADQSDETIGAGLVGLQPSPASGTYPLGTVGAALQPLAAAFIVRTDTATPHIGMGITAVPESLLVIESDNVRDGNNVGNVVQVQRVFNTTPSTDPNILRNGIRSLTTVNASLTNIPAIWAISGEVVLNAGSTSGSGIGGATALSGVVTKHAAGYSAIAGHFQVIDDVHYAAPGNVSPAVSAEMNLKVIGLDHATANETAGNRVVQTIYARGADDVQPNECGTAILIRHTNDGGDGGKGYFRFGIFISDQMNTIGHHSMDTALRIDTAGRFGVWMVGNGHTTADMFLDSPSAVGIILRGGGTGYTTGIALRVDDNYICLDPSGLVKFRHETGKIQFYNGATKCGYLDLTAGDHAL